MTTATLNWAFGPQSGVPPVSSCTFSVLVTRDGAPLPSFSVTTNAAGIASGTYLDTTASATATHEYRFFPQMAGCSANCSMTNAAVSWSCAGVPPPPPPLPPISTGCPTIQDSFTLCGQTAPPLQVLVGGAVALAQNFANATSVAITPTVPGLTPFTATTGGQLTGTASTAGTYNVQFKGSKAGCVDCITTYPLIVGTAANSTQSVRVLRGASAYVPVSLTSFNAADQVLEVSVTGPPGKTFTLVGTGTINVTSPVLTIPPSGTFTYSVPTGQSSAYSTAWGFVPAGPNPLVLTNPTAVTITGSTSLTLAVSQVGLTFTIVVTSPAGANAVPFDLSFGGASFGGSAVCATNTFGTTNTALNTGSSGGGNTFTYGPITITAPYSAAFKLATNAGSVGTHIVAGAACGSVSF